MPKTPERERPGSAELQEQPALIVRQPERIQHILAEFESISERAPERATEDVRGGGAATATGGQQGTLAAYTPRDQAIANLPEPKVMQKELEKHIKKEIRHLRKEANRIVRLSKPGAAFHLNELYARIRRLSNLLAEILEASYDVLKRIFIRVFIDRQPIL